MLHLLSTHFVELLTFKGAFFIAGRLSLHINIFIPSSCSTILQPKKKK